MNTPDRKGNAATELYAVHDFPIFQNRMYGSRDEALDCPKGDIKLVEDAATGLVHNRAFRPELMDYDDRYQNEQAASAVFRAHLDYVVGIIDRWMGGKSIVEVGCGKGYFLEMLQAGGFDIRGCDPTYEGSNPQIIKHNFSADLGINAEGLVLRHVLEHIPDPVDFLMGMAATNGGTGLIYIEVPCFDWICEQRAWFDIFYEHVNYFRLSDFSRMFGVVHESGWLFGGQYLYVVADLVSLRRPTIDEGDRVRFPSDFSGRLHHVVGAQSSEVVVWGGASKGVIFSLMMERAGAIVDTVIDINPGKQGKHLPATGLQVQSPEEVLPNLPRDATIFVMNSNYLEEIRSMSDNRFSYVVVDHG